VTDTRTAVKVSVNDVIRFLLEIFAVLSLALWGFLSWHFPVNVIVGVGAPALAIVLWALFRSPKAVFQIDPFGRALVEIVVMAAAAFAWWSLGQPVVAIVFAILATVSGFINGRREFR
jgi:Protein of unknown function (DUF2568)